MFLKLRARTQGVVRQFQVAHEAPKLIAVENTELKIQVTNLLGRSSSSGREALVERWDNGKGGDPTQHSALISDWEYFEFQAMQITLGHGTLADCSLAVKH